MQYAVVAEHFDVWDIDVLAPVFRSCLGLAAYDAKHRARRARGILAEELERGEAEAIAAALSPEYRVVVVEQHHVPRLGTPRRVRRLRCEPTALVVPLGHGGPREVEIVIPWERIELLSAGAVHVVERITDEGIDVDTGDDDGRGLVWRSNTRTDEYDEIRADLVARGASGEPDVHLRLVATQLVYREILGEEATVDPEESAVRVNRDNFRQVLARIGRGARWADVPPPTVALIAARDLHPRPPEQTRFSGDDEFDRFNRWCLALRRGPASP